MNTEMITIITTTRRKEYITIINGKTSLSLVNVDVDANNNKVKKKPRYHFM